MLLAAQQRLPRIEMLRFMEVAVRDVRVVLEARHRKQIVAVRRFPDVDEPGEPLAVVPEIAGADFYTSGRPVVRMAGDAQGVLPANLLQDVFSRLIGADELVDVQRDDV